MGIPNISKSPEARNGYALTYLDSRPIPPEYAGTLENIRAKVKDKIPLGIGDNKALEILMLESQKIQHKGKSAIIAGIDSKIKLQKSSYKLADPYGYSQMVGEVEKAKAPAQTEAQQTGYNLNGDKAGPQAGDVSTMPTGGVKGSAQTPGGSQSITSRSAAIKYDDQGRPIRNDYLSIADSSGNLLNQFNLSNRLGADVALNQDGYNQIKANATAVGPTDWAKMQLADQSLKQANLINQSNKSNVSAQQQAMSQLASKGGISQGQRERLAMQGARQQTASNQGILNQGMQQQLQVGLQDQQRKDQFLNQLPAMDMANANFNQQQRQYRDAAQQFDLGNQLKDVAGFNAYRADAYGEAAKMWGADKSANAQAAASGGGGKK